MQSEKSLNNFARYIGVLSESSFRQIYHCDLFFKLLNGSTKMKKIISIDVALICSLRKVSSNIASDGF